MGNLCGGNPDAARIAKIPCGMKVDSENKSQKSPNRAFKLGPEAVKELSNAVPYVFFNWISHSHLFNKIDIQPTYMHKYSRSLSLVPHSLIHMLI